MFASFTGCVDGRQSSSPASSQSPSAPRTPSSTAAPSPTKTATPAPTESKPSEPDAPAPPAASEYPWHTNIVSTTFWVGEIFDASAADGSQEISTYDSDWLGSYGGCDGLVVGAECRTEARVSSNGYFPSSMKPRENPFYLDLPYDDINDRTGFANRDAVIPWASESAYASHRGDPSFSYMKNRWVEITRAGAICFGQIQDAGPGEYHDAAYVFGTDDARPANSRYGGAGLDVSPALTSCLGYPEINGQSAVVNWRFVDTSDVPRGPWLTIVTTSQVR
ncbi:hypothetical protein I6E56_11945 [Salinibacterium sp. NK8237]|nr:hypothetical protein [Salinibacterium sp. NK8237]